MKTAQWLRELGAISRPRDWLVPSVDDCALLVVDMLRYFADPSGRAFIPASKIIVPRIKRLLESWRANCGLVVFTRHCHRPGEDRGMLGRFFDDYIDCSETDSEIIDDLRPLNGEKIIRKRTYDAFFRTGLEEYIRDAGACQIMIVGLLTQLCCETTARSAFVRGLEVYFPADANATSHEQLHVGSLSSLASGFAVVDSTENLLSRAAGDDA